jgi:hypothetical protein
MDVGTLAKSKYISLTTFRRDGTPVATPVWVAQQGDELVVYTVRSSGKAKRLRNSSRVSVAPVRHARSRHWRRSRRNGPVAG